jgi:hypothetical protein
MSGDARARLSWIEFLDAIEQIAQMSRNANDASWIVESSSQARETIGSRWLVKRNDIKQVAIDQMQTDELEAWSDDDDDDDDEQVSEDDAATLTTADERNLTTTRTLSFEWHVCYRAAFQAPALYFRVAELDGAPLTNDVVLPTDCSVPRSAITQAPHPVLETPFWHIHPCETAQAMAVPLQQLPLPPADAPVLPLSRNYVAIWLTMYAVPLGVSSLFQSPN